eukprot:3380241-Amphidinium_carterae.1
MFGHNGTTRAVEKFDHGGIDEIVALSRLVEGGLGVAVFTRLGVNVVPKFSYIGFEGSVQLGVADVDLPFSITGAYHPEFMKMMFWKLFALPFGATASVFAFNQCA